MIADTRCWETKSHGRPGFVPEVSFEEGLARTIQWYQENVQWTRRVRPGEYRDYYQKNYAWRSTA
jgi:dTDP-glucose 4,6-dehydratase